MCWREGVWWCMCACGKGAAVGLWHAFVDIGGGGGTHTWTVAGNRMHENAFSCIFMHFHAFGMHFPATFWQPRMAEDGGGTFSDNLEFFTDFISKDFDGFSTCFGFFWKYFLQDAS